MDLKIFAKDLEQTAQDQINELMAQEAFKDAKVRIMPDCHSGKGCVIGFTANLGEKVVPNLVGVDISCSMLTVKLGEKASDLDLEAIDKAIHENIKAGFNVHAKPLDECQMLEGLKVPLSEKALHHIKCSLGTLGGGKVSATFRSNTSK